LKRFALILALAMALGAAPARAEVDVYANVHLSGTNGYKLLLYGYEHRVYLDTFAAGSDVTYWGKGLVTRKRIEFDLGSRGGFDLSFEPRGELREGHVPRFCQGYTRRQPGVFTGVAMFTGDDGYTSVSTDTAHGSVVLSDVHCHRPPIDFVPPNPPQDQPHTHHLVGLDANGPYYIPAFFAEHRDGSRRARFNANSWERDGAIQIYRSVSSTAPRSAFTFDLRSDKATVAPPPPFSGQASYDGRADPPDIWTGDLAVALPGAGTVALTGPIFEAELYRATEISFKARPPSASKVLRRSVGL
jgi:hypothetical protein